MSSEAELLSRVREEFLADRTRQEMQVADWAKKLAKIDPIILKDVDLPEEISLQGLIPELYKANPDPEVYKVQYDSCIAIFEKVNQIADHYNEEAKKCLLEYQEMSLK